eukprot:76978_1
MSYNNKPPLKPPLKPRSHHDGQTEQKWPYQNQPKWPHHTQPLEPPWWQNRNDNQVHVDYSDSDELDDELENQCKAIESLFGTSGNTVQQFRKQNASLKQQMSHLRHENIKSQSILRNEATKLRKEVATAEK